MSIFEEVEKKLTLYLGVKPVKCRECGRGIKSGTLARKIQRYQVKCRIANHYNCVVCFLKEQRNG